MVKQNFGSPFAFDYENCHYIFDETHIYHCLEDNSRYVVGVFTFNGGHDNWIKFRQRRRKDNSWGGFINHRLESFGYVKQPFGKHSYDNKFKPHTYDIQNTSVYSLEIFNENKERRKNGWKDLKPLVYEDEVIDAWRTIIRTSIQTYHRNCVSIGQPLNVGKALEEYDKDIIQYIIQYRFLKKVDEDGVNPFLYGFETSSSSSASFEVMCLNAVGYEGKFVNGGSYMAFEADDDMIEVVSGDGSKHLMFKDRFVRV